MLPHREKTTNWSVAMVTIRVLAGVDMCRYYKGLGECIHVGGMSLLHVCVCVTLCME